MAKAHRSPLLGYNHNVGHLGRVFHVQTEDSGPAAPRVFTHLFHEGTILVSRKVEYEALLADDKVRVLMQTQHRAVIKDLAGGSFNERIVTFFRARGIELAVGPAVAVPVPVQGAVPSATINDSSDAPVGPAAAPPPAAAVPAPVPAPAPLVAPMPVVVPARTPVSPPRRNTRPIETGRTRKPTPPPVTVRPPDARRPPFVRSGAPAVSKTTSADGVVVQRSVVVGGVSTGDARPRIRPPVPYIVTGGSHTVRPPAGPAETKAPPPAAPPPPVILSAADAPPRPPGAFGPPVPDDKSLDEVILEYLSEDGD